LHPLVIHFPLALLAIAPLPLIVSAFWTSQRKGMLAAFLALMVLGTVGAVVATATGEAAEEHAERVAGTEKVLHDHEELGEAARNAYLALTGLSIAAIVAYFVLRARVREPLYYVGVALLTLLLIAGNVLLANAAHHGGKLVHELGVRGWPQDAGAAPLQSGE
jgi:uncharacterized membrane protein